MVTHDREIAARAGRIVKMRDGRVVDDGRPTGSATGERVLP
jgi:ABC-type lipoprotein export system ATPase subunit